jgi:hypothetical protein
MEQKREYFKPVSQNYSASLQKWLKQASHSNTNDKLSSSLPTAHKDWATVFQWFSEF